jgi:large subunit ribosomal protein L10
MLRSDKEKVVAQLAERLKSSETLIVADYRGLTMPEIDDLRGKLLDSGARFSVVKNTLTRRAAEEAGVEELLGLLEGPTAIAFLEADGDPVAAAKVLSDTARATNVLVIRGGLLEGSPVSDAEITRLATLPPADVLRAQLAGAVVAPLTTVVALFTAPLRDLVNVLDARIEQLRERGEDAPAAEAGAADAPAETPADEPAADEPAAESDAASGAEPAAEAETPAADESNDEEPAAGEGAAAESEEA